MAVVVIGTIPHASNARPIRISNLQRRCFVIRMPFAVRRAVLWGLQRLVLERIWRETYPPVWRSQKQCADDAVVRAANRIGAWSWSPEKKCVHRVKDHTNEWWVDKTNRLHEFSPNILDQHARLGNNIRIFHVWLYYSRQRYSGIAMLDRHIERKIMGMYGHKSTRATTDKLVYKFEMTKAHLCLRRAILL
jgi:hypothetical protein